MILLMLSNFIIWSTAAFGGTPFRLNKCTASYYATGLMQTVKKVNHNHYFHFGKGRF